MKRALVILLVAAGMVLVSPSVALACSCARASVADHLDHADTVVVGTMAWVADDGIDRTFSVAVDQVFKGKAGLREKVHTSGEASCGLGDLATDKQYVFFLEGTHPGRLTANLCGGTAPYSADVVNEVQKRTGGPFEPMPTYVTDTEPSSGPDPIRIVGIGAFVLAALAGAVLVLRRRFSGPKRGTGEVG
jgi:MYXO-CTERM domain-containing protein